MASKEVGTDDEHYYRELTPNEFILWVTSQYEVLDQAICSLEERKNAIQSFVDKANWGWDMGMKVTIFEVDGALGVNVTEKPPLGFGT